VTEALPVFLIHSGLGVEGYYGFRFILELDIVNMPVVMGNDNASLIAGSSAESI
jgi:hypothetical protein